MASASTDGGRTDGIASGPVLPAAIALATRDSTVAPSSACTQTRTPVSRDAASARPSVSSSTISRSG